MYRRIAVSLCFTALAFAGDLGLQEEVSRLVKEGENRVREELKAKYEPELAELRTEVKRLSAENQKLEKAKHNGPFIKMLRIAEGERDQAQKELEDLRKRVEGYQTTEASLKEQLKTAKASLKSAVEEPRNKREARLFTQLRAAEERTKICNKLYQMKVDEDLEKEFGSEQRWKIDLLKKLDKEITFQPSPLSITLEELVSGLADIGGFKVTFDLMVNREDHIKIEQVECLEGSVGAILTILLEPFGLTYSLKDGGILIWPRPSYEPMQGLKHRLEEATNRLLQKREKYPRVTDDMVPAGRSFHEELNQIK
ncbi:MAG: hypothetical protein ISS36_00715 [Candidatus Aenigmarchaeota archaeon]|nr:hypothetical protein [Candidatus Aenigmarchaeota archaeon]